MAVAINGPSFTAPSDNNFQRLSQQGSSGLRINSAADDAAGAAIGSRMSTQVSGINVASRNIGDGMSMLQSRSGLASGLTEQVQRMRELAVQANNGTNSPQDRQALNQEFTALRDGVLEQVGNATFNGQPLFGNDPQTLQTGPEAGQTTVLAANGLPQALEEQDFGLLSLAQAGDLGSVLTRLDGALGAITDSQVQDGATANRLEQQADNLGQRRLDESQSLSRVQDLDYAQFAAELAQENTRNQAQVMVQSQANVGRQDVLRLLGG